MKGQLDTSNKILNMVIVLSSYGGLYTGIINFLNPKQSLIWIFCNLFLSVLAGALLGSVAVYIPSSGKIKPVHYDKNGDILLKNQKLVYFTVIIFGSSYLFNSWVFERDILNIAILNSGLFILGLMVGLYDNTYNLTSRLVYSGLIPVFLSIVYLISGNQIIRIIIWVMIFAYIFCGFLAINRLNLNKNLFGASDINIKDSSSISKMSIVSVIFLSSFSIFLIYISRYLRFLYNWFKLGLLMVYKLAEIITSWIYKRKYAPVPEESEQMVLPKTELSLVAVIILIIIIAICFVALVMIIKYLLTIRLKRKLKTKRGLYIGKEYEEEISYVKENQERHRKRSKQYTRKGIASLNNEQEKIRYLYGYFLERLYSNNNSITRSNTPSEILCKIEQHRKFKRAVYKDLTKDYIYVRYGYKKVRPDYSFMHVARIIDKDFT